MVVTHACDANSTSVFVCSLFRRHQCVPPALVLVLVLVLVESTGCSGIGLRPRG